MPAPRIQFDSSAEGKAWQAVFDSFSDYLDSGKASKRISVVGNLLMRDVGSTILLEVPKVTPGTDVPRSLKASLSGTEISVTSGYVNGIVPTMGGTSLDDPTPPTLALGSLPFYALLRVEWVPGAAGESPAFTADSFTSLASVTVVGAGSVTAMTLPEVDPDTGAATVNGIGYFPLAHWVDADGVAQLASPPAHGIRQFAVCGDTDFRLWWNGF